MDQTQHEPRWLSAVIALVTAALYLALPTSIRIGPSWLLLAIVALLLIPTLASHRAGRHEQAQRLGYLISGVLTVFLVASVGLLLCALINQTEPATALLRSAAALWLANVLLFAAWYWRLDGGGPHLRDARARHQDGAFLFPQMTRDNDAGWHPTAMDYLFLAFNTSTALSPTDTAVMSRWAKLLMMLQALVSLLIVGVLAARAVNIL